jgi:hypothetical protein
MATWEDEGTLFGKDVPLITTVKNTDLTKGAEEHGF